MQSLGCSKDLHRKPLDPVLLACAGLLVATIASRVGDACELTIGPFGCRTCRRPHMAVQVRACLRACRAEVSALAAVVAGCVYDVYQATVGRQRLHKSTCMDSQP